MDCVVVSDAWVTAYDYDLKYHPNINQLNYAFGQYLNSNLSVMRESMHIYHDATGREIMDCVDTTADNIVNSVYDIPDVYENYYICGFHLGRCTHKKAFALAQNRAHRRGKIFVVHNLSMLWPSDTLTKLLEPEWFPLVNYSTHKGFYTEGVPTEQSLYNG